MVKHGHVLFLKHCQVAGQSGNLFVLLCRHGSLLSEVIQTMFGDLYESAKEKGCETGDRKQKFDIFFKCKRKLEAAKCRPVSIFVRPTLTTHNRVT